MPVSSTELRHLDLAPTCAGEWRTLERLVKHLESDDTQVITVPSEAVDDDLLREALAEMRGGHVLVVLVGVTEDFQVEPFDRDDVHEAVSSIAEITDDFAAMKNRGFALSCTYFEQPEEDEAEEGDEDEADDQDEDLDDEGEEEEDYENLDEDSWDDLDQDEDDEDDDEDEDEDDDEDEDGACPSNVIPFDLDEDDGEMGPMVAVIRVTRLARPVLRAG